MIDSAPPVIKRAEMTTPRVIKERAFQYSTPKMKAITAPSTLPKPGSGIATTRIIMMAPNLLKSLEFCLWVVWKSFWKNLSISWDFLRLNRETGSIIARIIAAGTIVPMMAKMSVVTLERPSFMPKGMASFRFNSGVIAAKKTESS